MTANDDFQPHATVRLAFADEAAFAHVTDPVHEDLSAAARVADSLFLCCDETAGVDRLTPVGAGHWGHHTHFNLGRMFDLPDGPDGEMDIEGLAADGGWLWVVGSHALKRGKPKRDEHDAAKALKRLRRLERDPNRFFLGRVPLAQEGDGVVRPVDVAGARRAQSVPLAKKASALRKWLADEPLLDAAFALPAKENGFDIEGLAVRGERVWLGLRGPVVNGHAIVVELDMKTAGDGHLKARKLDGKTRYRLHLLDTGGLGVRELTLDGPDLLILLGPTMSAEGPGRILRWRDAIDDATSGVIAADRLEWLHELPYHAGVDHAEGLEPWPEAGERAFLVIYDGPADHRVDHHARTVDTDVVTLPPR
ncbi:MAG: DUF3616 domain-containing protein [Alphaproteobacteria bacterium]|nr:DUF3616 domain-containing protein [Alphaproteobacteria bacterium]